MLTLQVFGPGLGLPDPSPFVCKAMMLLKIAGLDYQVKPVDVRKAPKQKLPVLDDNGQLIADTTFIRAHIEAHHGYDFDKALSDEQKAVAWAVEKMCEDHLYWIALHERWADDANFHKGPAQFFNVLPAIVRPLIKSMVRKQIIKSCHAHGMGRHSKQELQYLGEKAIGSIATILADKTYIMGAEPCGADATIFSFLLGGRCPVFDSHLRNSINAHANLVAYVERMTKHYFPELV